MREKIMGRRKEMRMFCDVTFILHKVVDFSDSCQTAPVAGPKLPTLLVFAGKYKTIINLSLIHNV
jgi:hypothetical protein